MNSQSAGDNVGTGDKDGYDGREEWHWWKRYSVGGGGHEHSAFCKIILIESFRFAPTYVSNLCATRVGTDGLTMVPVPVCLRLVVCISVKLCCGRYVRTCVLRSLGPSMCGLRSSGQYVCPVVPTSVRVYCGPYVRTCVLRYLCPYICPAIPKSAHVSCGLYVRT